MAMTIAPIRTEEDQDVLARAEMGVLASAMLISECMDDLSFLDPDHFRSQTNGEIFDALRFLHSQGKPTDAVVLAECLSKRKRLGECGGPAYLAEVLDSVPHAAHAAYYGQIVYDRWQRREIEYASAAASRDASNLNDTPAEIAARAEGRLHKVIEAEAGQAAVSVDQVMLNLWQVLEAPTVHGQPTGFRGIDEKVTGLKPGSLTIVGARPSIGKTAFAGRIALNFATRGVGVMFFSLEQPQVELAERWLSSYSAVTLHQIRHQADMTQDDREMLLAQSSILSSLPLFIDDAPGRTMSQIEATSRLWKRRHGIGLIVVDYLQLIEPEDRRAPREQQVSQTSRRLKFLARTLEVPVICLAQLNRSSESRTDKRPQLSDLRESGSIEQDGDAVMLLHRPAFYSSMTGQGQDDDPTYAECLVAKNRGGKTGLVKLHWNGDRMTFSDRETETAEYQGDL